MFILSDLEGMVVLVTVGMASICATAYCYTKIVAFNVSQEEEDRKIRIVMYGVIILVALMALGVGIWSDPTLKRMASVKASMLIDRAAPALPKVLRNPTNAFGPETEAQARMPAPQPQVAPTATLSPAIAQAPPAIPAPTPTSAVAAPVQTQSHQSAPKVSAVEGGPGAGRHAASFNACQSNRESVTKLKFWFNIATFLLAAFLLYRSKSPTEQQFEPPPPYY